MTASPFIFDRAAVRRHWQRARPSFARHDALFAETAEQIAERLEPVRRSFARVLDLSPQPFLPHPGAVGARQVRFDEEYLPFATGAFDLIGSNLALHWVNDLPGTLTQIRACLAADGLFIAALIGGSSLHELRGCLLDAELSVTGGVSPRLSPTVDLLAASQLLQRAGFSLPVADTERVTLLYRDAFQLMHELRGMGQANAHTARLRHATRRAVLFEAARLYHERFAQPDGMIPATFEIIHLHGWAA